MTAILIRRVSPAVELLVELAQLMGPDTQAAPNVAESEAAESWTNAPAA